MPTADYSSFHQPNSTTSDGSKFDNFIDAVQASINGLDNNNIAALAGILLSKLAQAGALTGQLIAWNGTTWAPGSQGLYRKTTAKTVSNTVAETDLLNGEITIAAGVLGTTGMLRVSTFIDMLANSGGAATWRFKIKLGGTTVFDTGVLSLPNEGSPRTGMTLDFELLNTGAAATNVCRVKLGLPLTSLAALTAPAMTAQSWGAGSWGFGLAAFATTIDTSASKLLEITVQHGTAAATIETKLYGAVAEVL